MRPVLTEEQRAEIAARVREHQERKAAARSAAEEERQQRDARDAVATLLGREWAPRFVAASQWARFCVGAAQQIAGEAGITDQAAVAVIALVVDGAARRG